MTDVELALVLMFETMDVARPMRFRWRHTKWISVFRSPEHYWCDGEFFLSSSALAEFVVLTWRPAAIPEWVEND